MKILVTGGAGFVGAHLVKELVKEHAVVVFDDLSHGKVNRVSNKAEFIKGDIRNKEMVKRIVKGVDVVYHLAAPTSVAQSIKNPEETQEIIFQGTENIVDNLSSQTKLVYFSSAAVYGEQKNFPIKENAPLNPPSPYGQAKVMAEKVCFSHENCVIARPFNIYGSGQEAGSSYSGVISKFFSCAQKNKSLPLFGDGQQTRDFVSVEDAVRASIFLGLGDYQGIYNIGTGKETKIIMLAKIINELFHKDLEIIHRPARMEEIKRSVAAIKKIKSIGWAPSYSLQSGLQELIKHED